MIRPNKKKKTLKGKFEPVIDTMFKGMAEEYGYEVRYEPKVYDINIRHEYIPDYELKYPDGREVIVEVKGYFRYEDQRKALAFRRDYPNIDYRLVFQKNNPIRKGSKTTYLDWAKKNNIPAVVGPDIPKEWFE